MRSLRDRIAPLGMTKLWVRIAAEIDQQVGVQAGLRKEHKVPRLRNAFASRPDCSARDDNVTGENCLRDRSAGLGCGLACGRNARSLDSASRSLRERIAPLGITMLWVRIASEVEQQVGGQLDVRAA